MKRRFRAIIALTSFAVLTACAVNPATGRRELSLIGEGREIAMGREADPQITASLGLVDDPELQQYVSDLGLRMAAVSERPNLPWSFKVVDDPIVNAFALPGGFIYVTRGILARFDSEAELAGVLGHEIGHVTARHSVSQMSNQTLLAGALGVGMIFSERVRDAGGLLGAGIQVLGLKFSRDDELQSDELGLRYMSRIGYDPEALVGVFQMLGAVSGGGGRVPEWQATHPNPENRESRIRELIAQAGAPTDGTVARDRYLDHLDGMMYGPNPREGFFMQARFVHPDLAFELTFPSGWQGVNQKTAVAALSPEQDAMVILQLSEAADAETGLRAFLSQDGVSGGRIERSDEGGLQRRRASFVMETSDGTLRGEAAFVELDEQVYGLIGLATNQRWQGYARAVRQSLMSFDKVVDPGILAVQPHRLEIHTLSAPTSLRALMEGGRSPVELDEIASLNRVDPDAELPAGTRIKRVAGEPLPGR